jgi:hypothetical protein
MPSWQDLFSRLPAKAAAILRGAFPLALLAKRRLAVD